MKLLKQHDIPFFITTRIARITHESITDKCPGRSNCLNEYETCQHNGKHLSRIGKIEAGTDFAIIFPLLLAADILNMSMFPLKVGLRLCFTE